MLRYVCLLALISSQPSCESCAFSFGSISVRGLLTVKGPVPDEILVRTCSGPRADDCRHDGYVQVQAGFPSTFQAEIEPVGTFTCGFDQRWLVITGTGCETFAEEVIASEDIEGGFADAAMVDLENYDVTLYCGQSSAEEL